MPESCQNCGAGLYAGQQYCRRCGASVGAAAAGGEAPTQLFPEGAPTAAATAVNTSPLGGRTDAVGRLHETAYRPPLEAFRQTSRLPAGPPKARGRRGAWLFALFAVFVLGAGLASGAAFLWWRTRHRPVVKVVKTGPHGERAVPAVPEVPRVPEVPADLGDRIKSALKGAGVPLPLDESGAVVSGGETVLTRTFELDEGSSFSAHVTSGNVTVVGADGEQAVVKIVKRGGSERERAGARVLASESEEGVALISAAPPDGRVSVSYEIAVPRGLHRLEISVDRGDVRVSDFGGAVTADVQAGDVEFRGVSGEVRSKLIKGNTRVFHTGAEREGAQQFSVVKGDIEATVGDEAHADLKAETLDGEIELDERFGLRVVRARAGRNVAGRLGGGGEPLVLKVTDGDISLKK